MKAIWIILYFLGSFLHRICLQSFLCLENIKWYKSNLNLELAALILLTTDRNNTLFHPLQTTLKNKVQHQTGFTSCYSKAQEKLNWSSQKKKKQTWSNHWELTTKLKKSSQAYGLFIVITFYKLYFTNREKVPFSGWKQALVLLWNVPCVSLETHICNICKAGAGGRFLERQKIMKTNFKVCTVADKRQINIHDSLSVTVWSQLWGQGCDWFPSVPPAPHGAVRSLMDTEETEEGKPPNLLLLLLPTPQWPKTLCKVKTTANNLGDELFFHESGPNCTPDLS